MNYSEVVLQSPGPDRADKSSRCSESVCPSQRKWFSLSLTCLCLLSFFSSSTAPRWETSTKIYKLKLELSILFPTLSPSLCRPPCGFRRVKSGLFREADGSLPARLSALTGQTPVQAGKRNPLNREALRTMYTVSMCKHPFRGLPWDDEGTQLGPEESRQEVQQDSPEFLSSRPRDGSA